MRNRSKALAGMVITTGSVWAMVRFRLLFSFLRFSLSTSAQSLEAEGESLAGFLF